MKFGLHAFFVLLINAFNFGPSLSTIALYPVAFDSDKTFLRIIRKLVSSLPNFYFPISNFIPSTVTHKNSCSRKLENRNWKFGFHARVLLMNAFHLSKSCQRCRPVKRRGLIDSETISLVLPAILS